MVRSQEIFSLTLVDVKLVLTQVMIETKMSLYLLAKLFAVDVDALLSHVNLYFLQRRKMGQSRMRIANWWYSRKEYSISVKCYKKALQYYNNIPTNQVSSQRHWTPGAYPLFH